MKKDIVGCLGVVGVLLILVFAGLPVNAVLTDVGDLKTVGKYNNAAPWWQPVDQYLNGSVYSGSTQDFWPDYSDLHFDLNLTVHNTCGLSKDFQWRITVSVEGNENYDISMNGDQVVRNTYAIHNEYGVANNEYRSSYGTITIYSVRWYHNVDITAQCTCTGHQMSKTWSWFGII